MRSKHRYFSVILIAALIAIGGAGCTRAAVDRQRAPALASKMPLLPKLPVDIACAEGSILPAMKNGFVFPFCGVV